MMNLQKITMGIEAIVVRRFADWICKTPPGTLEKENTWYTGSSEGPVQRPSSKAATMLALRTLRINTIR